MTYSLKPAGNIIFGFLGGALACVAMQYAKKIGYAVPDDIAPELPLACAALLSHGWDVITGQNKPAADQVAEKLACAANKKD